MVVVVKRASNNNNNKNSKNNNNNRRGASFFLIYSGRATLVITALTSLTPRDGLLWIYQDGKSEGSDNEVFEMWEDTWLWLKA